MKFAINVAKTILLILIFASCTIESIGQTLTCRVIEATTKAPIEFAHISLERNKLGSVSKENGETTIELPQQYLEYDKLYCSFVGYNDTSFTLNISDFITENQPVVITLSFAFQQIQTIEVSDKSSDLTGREIIKKALKNVKRNYIRSTTPIECFYREKSYENDNFIEFNETVAAVKY
ncbi:MAG: hypothetical protein AB8G11_26365, partial [Saprospiraceae bacterium]